MTFSDPVNADHTGYVDVESLAAKTSAAGAIEGMAAFFDVDNTLVQGSSAGHFGRWPRTTTSPIATCEDSSTPMPSSRCSGSYDDY